MNKNIEKRLLRTFVLCIIALGIGAGVAFYQLKLQNARVISKSTGTNEPLPVAGLAIGGPFSLSNHDGVAVSEQTYAGQYTFIYFGFTYCPAICPTELQKVSRIMTALEKKNPEIAEIFQPLFITVDPERDTVEVMKDYVSLFHPKLIGLRGTQPQTDFITKAYRIFARKVDDPDSDDPNDYTMDHSSYLYLMGPDNKLMGLYRMDDSADDIYKDIVKRIEASQA